jgi:hypothetical protein
MTTRFEGAGARPRDEAHAALEAICAGDADRRNGCMPEMVRSSPSLHLMMTLHHEQAREAYVRDVAACVDTVKQGRTLSRRGSQGQLNALGR